MKLYLVARFSHEGAPDHNAQDTIYFVRAKHHLAAVKMVEDELRRQPNVNCLPHANLVYLVGHTITPDSAFLTFAPAIAFAYNYGCEKRWVRQFPDEPWRVYDGGTGLSNT